jgi:GT2 family glycosyltransferase
VVSRGFEGRLLLRRFEIVSKAGFVQEVQKRVSVIVVNWNGRSLLEACLSALCRQTYGNREIIFVDNGSTDDSIRLVRNKFSSVAVVELTENKGFTGGNLEALRIAQGSFIALVNNDVRADDSWLENILQPMLNDPEVGTCASKMLFEETKKTKKINSAGGALTTACVGFDRGFGTEGARYATSERVFGAPGAAVVYRRKMLDEIGFLDEDFFLYNEDTDLSFRAQLAGWKCVYVPTAIVYHKSHATSGRLSNLHVYHHTRNLEFVWIKNMPGWLMARYAHHKLIQEIGAFCYLCLRRRQWRPFFKAKKDALKMLPKMWRKRREIQKTRRVTNRYIQGLLTPIYSKELLRQKLRQFIRGQ